MSAKLSPSESSSCLPRGSAPPHDALRQAFPPARSPSLLHARQELVPRIARCSSWCLLKCRCARRLMSRFGWGVGCLHYASWSLPVLWAGHHEGIQGRYMRMSARSNAKAVHAQSPVYMQHAAGKIFLAMLVFLRPALVSRSVEGCSLSPPHERMLHVHDVGGSGLTVSSGEPQCVINLVLRGDTPKIGAPQCNTWSALQGTLQRRAGHHSPSCTFAWVCTPIQVLG